MGSKASTPAPPDPYATSAAQTGSNVATAAANAALNRYTTNTPLGNSSWTTNGTTTITDPSTGMTYQVPNYVNDINLNPTAQATLAASQGNQLGFANIGNTLLGNVGGTLGKQMDTSSLPGVASSVNTSGLPQIASSVNPVAMGDKSVQDAINQSYQSQLGLIQPLMQQQSRGLEDQLAAEGITQGSDAYNTAKQNLAREQSNQLAGLTAQSVQQGIGLQNQLFGQNLSNAGLQNSAQQQGYQQGLSGSELQNAANQQQLAQLMALYNQPLNELSALQSGSQVQMPSFQGSPSVSMPGTNVAGNVYSSYQGQLNAANAQNAASNSLLGGLAQLGGTLGGAYMMMPSDRRLKKNVRLVGKHYSGLNLYAYHYLWDDGESELHLGFMADEVRKVNPAAVVVMPSGYDAVNYGALL